MERTKVLLVKPFRVISWWIYVPSIMTSLIGINFFWDYLIVLCFNDTCIN